MSVPDLHYRLAQLNDLVDPAHVRESEKLIEESLSFRKIGRYPFINGSATPGWQGFPYSEAFHDMEKMLVNELGSVYQGAKNRDDRMYTIRANYGVGTVASMFGCEISLTMNNMPWCEPLSETELLWALDQGVPDLNSGLGARVFETERFYAETFAGYPNLKETVHTYVCDTQGPFDIAHLVMGHRIYTEIYDNPDLVHRLLDVCTDTYIAFTKAQKEIIGEGNDWHFHSANKIRGGVRVCEDSPTNLSPVSYLEFCRPYNERVLAEFGGWIHYCGGGHQILPHVLSTPGLTGINFGNPEKQDLHAVYDAAAPHKVGIITWVIPLAEQDARHITTGITLSGSIPPPPPG